MMPCGHPILQNKEKSAIYSEGHAYYQFRNVTKWLYGVLAVILAVFNKIINFNELNNFFTLNNLVWWKKN